MNIRESVQLFENGKLWKIDPQTQRLEIKGIRTIKVYRCQSANVESDIVIYDIYSCKLLEILVTLGLMYITSIGSYQYFESDDPTINFSEQFCLTYRCQKQIVITGRNIRRVREMKQPGEYTLMDKVRCMLSKKMEMQSIEDENIKKHKQYLIESEA
ncbi:MAG: hypothetical protein EZS28_014058 [Streblomastix strix]|uniref:Uncharacterized protein n=1 Tax=Streblomastix strix TaxID=222440 RepID=A0A5J4W6R6_9EUKA|nr:MAG: hypothetical protein EZS28_014058 [Streblomastix strix]